MSAGPSIIDALHRRSLALSRAVADLLARCEGVLQGGNNAPSGAPTAASLSSNELLSMVGRDWLGDSGLELDEDRIARVALCAWASTVPVGHRSGRRPDVLAMTCDLLAEPTLPHTREVARFALVLGLRALHQVHYNNDSLALLKQAYSDLLSRFRQLKARRIRKNTERYEHFLIELSCLEGTVYRSLSGENLSAYYQSFAEFPLGINKSARQYAEKGQDWPQLRGYLPDFAMLMSRAFAQPVCIPGFDDVTYGLLAGIAGPAGRSLEGGLVTLVAGTPGSGKTSLCLTMTSRMAELGSTIRYISTEEESEALKAKYTTIASPHELATALLSSSPRVPALSTQFRIIDGRAFVTLSELVAQLEEEFEGAGRSERQPHAAYLAFPRVIVVDSVTTLLNSGGEQEPASRNGRDGRRELQTMLNKLRALGVCVFLVGEPIHCTDAGIAYLVDNVLELDVDRSGRHEHATRGFRLHKTRLQASHRGRHGFHLSRASGCMVSPSLHSVLRSVHEHGVDRGDSARRAVLWVGNNGRHTSIRGQSQTLVYGHGPAGKARLALALALEPRHPAVPERSWRKALSERAGDALSQSDRDAFDRMRVLVVSFLYGAPYYEEITRSIFRERYELSFSADELRLQLPRHLTTYDLYPGFIDPETLVARVRRELRSGRLDGRPYTAVVLDGIHNMVLQYPLLEKERLLWPALYRLLRAEGVDAVSTFTFFKLQSAEQSTIVPNTEHVTAMDSAQEIFFHLLVSNCDYTFVAERAMSAPPNGDPNWLAVRRTTSVEPYGKECDSLWFDPVRLSFKARE